jgi:hypothetical protein
LKSQEILESDSKNSIDSMDSSNSFWTTRLIFSRGQKFHFLVLQEDVAFRWLESLDNTANFILLMEREKETAD